MKRIFRGAIIAAVLAGPLSATSASGKLDHSSSKDQQPAVDPKEGMVPRPATMAIVATGLLGIVGAGWIRRRRGRS